MSYSDEKTEAMLKALESKIAKEYRKAYEDVTISWENYINGYDEVDGDKVVHHNSLKERYEQEHKAYLDGKYTDEQFKAWYNTQLQRAEGWQAKRDELAKRMTQANMAAEAYINGTTPDIYNFNGNYLAYEVEKANVGVNFTLYDESTIKNLMTDAGNYTDFRTVKVNPKRDYEWNSKQIQSALTSGILQGKSIDGIADSFMPVMKRNRNAAVRNARTAVTSAQNAGRISRLHEAEAMGIEVQKRWLATSDARTRDSHAHLNGQIRNIDDEFDNGLLFPADPNGIGAEVYNCRCTLTYVYPKYQNKVSNEEYSEDKREGETYQQWVKRKRKEREDNGLKDITTEMLRFTDGKTARQLGYKDISELPQLDRNESFIYSAIKTNPNYDTIKSIFSNAYTQNCQRCVVAYEMRQRGMNVTAGARLRNEQAATTFLANGFVNPRSWANAFDGLDKRFVAVGKSGDIVTTAQEMSNYMYLSGAGSRGIIRVNYKKHQGGHVLNVINDNGHIRYIDAQVGREIQDITKLLDICELDSVMLARVDDLAITNKALRYVEVQK